MGDETKIQVTGVGVFQQLEPQMMAYLWMPMSLHEFKTMLEKLRLLDEFQRQHKRALAASGDFT